MARILTLYETYSREDVHDIYDPRSRFTPRGGPWGLWGIIQLPDKPGDFVLYVTFGREQSGHQFDEWITEDGIINWQSQPRQTLDDRRIQQFIHHDPSKNNIHLFLRTTKNSRYTYFGKLAYHSHDPKHEQPVWIQWQILDWKIQDSVLKNINLTLKPSSKNGEDLPFYRSTFLNDGIVPSNYIAETNPVYQSLPQARGFNWKGRWYVCSLETVNALVQPFIQEGLPEEATRFIDWYIEIDGVQVSPKWVFHLITKAGYSEFITTTASNKLRQIGLITKTKAPISSPFQLTLESVEEKQLSKEQQMYQPNRFRTSTVDALIDVFNDLTMVGEISVSQLDSWKLNYFHFFELLRSTLVTGNHRSILASPRLINLLPIQNINELLRKLSLPRRSCENWPYLAQKGSTIQVEEKYKILDQNYYLIPINETIYEDKTPRPVFLFDYFSNDNDWEDWTSDAIFKLHRVYTEPKLFVHSVLPIQNLYGGVSEVQNAVWKSAIYWIMTQLIILSDPETGAVYDPKIHLVFTDGWKDDSQVRIYIQDEYLGDVVDCLDTFMNCFNWVWVNRSGDPSRDQRALLGVLRLLLKLDIVELRRDGRLQFTNDYRSKLFESQEMAHLAYRNSKDARDQLREVIKDMRR